VYDPERSKESLVEHQMTVIDLVPAFIQSEKDVIILSNLTSFFFFNLNILKKTINAKIK